MRKLKFGCRRVCKGSPVLWCAFAAGLAVSAIVRAQEAPALEEIVVTSQKRAQSIETVPVSVSALGGSQLEAQGINDINDLSRQVPTLEVQTTNGAGTVDYRLRRVGNLGNIPSFEPAVGLFVDGAFRIRSFYGAGDMLDLDRIEVINGPQSTLYGKNTTAGVISMFTRAPASTASVSTEATIGQLDAQNRAMLDSFKGSLSGPLADGWGAGISAAYSGHDYLFPRATRMAPDRTRTHVIRRARN